MSGLQLSEHPHRRYDLLTGEWVLVSPHRMKRPWQGHTEPFSTERHGRYDPTCYLCPGNLRAGGVKNPNYTGTYAFDNDFSALYPETPVDDINVENILIAKGNPGICRVVCFSPRHDLTLPEMTLGDIGRVVDLWIEEYECLGQLDFINHIQIFENKGQMMGCSNSHPHGQIWAEYAVPIEVEKESHQLYTYNDKHDRCLLCDYLHLEAESGERIVCANNDFIALVPFWAAWPYETMIISQRHLSNLPALNEKEKDAFADILKRLTTRYDNLFELPFPYSSGIHQSPTDGAHHPEHHLHMHFYPPLLRSATVKKYAVGYEMLANPQRDMTPEVSAELLRGLSEIHYRDPVGP